MMIVGLGVWETPVVVGNALYTLRTSPAFSARFPQRFRRFPSRTSVFVCFAAAPCSPDNPEWRGGSWRS
jgi:hypothetical protein